MPLASLPPRLPRTGFRTPAAVAPHGSLDTLRRMCVCSIVGHWSCRLAGHVSRRGRIKERWAVSPVAVPAAAQLRDRRPPVPDRRPASRRSALRAAEPLRQCPPARSSAVGGWGTRCTSRPAMSYSTLTATGRGKANSSTARPSRIADPPPCREACRRVRSVSASERPRRVPFRQGEPTHPDREAGIASASGRTGSGGSGIPLRPAFRHSAPGHHDTGGPRVCRLRGSWALLPIAF